MNSRRAFFGKLVGGLAAVFVAPKVLAPATVVRATVGDELLIVSGGSAYVFPDWDRIDAQYRAARFTADDLQKWYLDADFTVPR